MRTLLASAASAATAFAATAALATTYDFTTLPVGAVAPNTYAGVTITEQNPGGADVTDAQANIGVVPGLTNSQLGYGGDPSGFNYPYYPTEQQIVFAFASPTSGVSFTFDNEGDNGITTYTAYDGATVVSSANIGLDNGVLEIVPGSAITSLVVDNQGNNWIYGISNLTFGAVPEPGTWALMMVGMGLLGAFARRRTSVQA
jgi:hypothetical protein